MVLILREEVIKMWLCRVRVWQLTQSPDAQKNMRGALICGCPSWGFIVLVMVRSTHFEPKPGHHVSEAPQPEKDGGKSLVQS